MEIWNKIENFEYYEISSYGRVKRLKHKIRNSRGGFRTLDDLIMTPYIDYDGYEIVGLVQKSGGDSKDFRVHRLVASAFIPNPDNLPEVNHIDGNKRNNNVENLEWTTHIKNVQHAYKLGLRSNKGIAIRCIETKEEFISIIQAAKYYNVSSDVISMLLYKYSKTSKLLPNKHFEIIQ